MLREDTGFYTGTLLWALLESRYGIHVGVSKNQNQGARIWKASDRARITRTPTKKHTQILETSMFFGLPSNIDRVDSLTSVHLQARAAEAFAAVRSIPLSQTTKP